MSIEEFQEILDKELGVMLYFSGEQCSVCHALRPKIKTLFDREFPQITQIYLDAQTHAKIASHYSVFALPTMIVFLAGREFVREGRTVSLHKLSQTLQRPYGMLTE
jgi:thioredoxin 1